ncbi:envelope stress response membrane protein PspB [Catenovulum sp. 2E275]|uniref:envelope stress response membrane protein PspB n=1 Tax=Catenovulum sp. 2E275 TaxID=2980497 RepID=UPI0021D2F52E|nr:envelope stress response membrane protein PspB [Catenovulum sp. 2E275]MCU4676734.1 envelope stress response membrane protein PspB [Catenovulum sp. 2E275]
MTAIVALIITPLILFMVFVAPIWLILSYRSKRQVKQGLTDDERSQMMQLADKAEQMSQRIKSLEKILDAESPSWREKHD